MRLTKIVSITFLSVILLSLLPACSDNDKNTSNEELVAMMNLPPLGAVDTSIVFNASGSSGTPIFYHFDFGDGETQTFETPFAFHQYSAPGDYNVRLTIENKNNETATYDQKLSIVSMNQPNLVFKIPDEPKKPELWEIPFPNDLYLDDKGYVNILPEELLNDLNASGAAIVSSGLNIMKGFGLTTAIHFQLPNPPLVQSLPTSSENSIKPGSSVCLINIDPNSEYYGERHPVETYYDETFKRLSVMPDSGNPLKPNTRYAALLTTTLVSEKGPYLPSEDFKALLLNKSGNNRAENLYQPLWNLLSQTDDLSNPNVISAATVFTTQDTLKELPAIRDYLKTQEISEVDFTTANYSRIYDTPAKLSKLFGSPDEELTMAPNPNCRIAYDSLKTIAIGSFTSLDFRDSQTGILLFDENGIPVPVSTNQVPIVFSIPNTPAPVSGFPVVVFQHGIGASVEDLVSVSNYLANAGFVTIGIDAVQHGHRYSGAKDNINNFTGEQIPDGLADYDSLSKLIGFLKSFNDLPAIRGNFRQTIVDLLQLINMVKQEDLDLSMIGSPMLDRDHIYLFGNSLGSFWGVTLLALEPTFDASIFTVSGGEIFPTFINSPRQFASNEVIFKGIFGLPSDYIINRFSLISTLGQMIFDGADNINYASWIYKNPQMIDNAIRQPPDILQIVVVGDDNVPNSSSKALAKALGLDIMAPYLVAMDGFDTVQPPVINNVSTKQGSATGAMVQISPGSHWELLYCETGTHDFVPGFPYPNGLDGERFPKLDFPVVVDMPKEDVWSQITHFLISKMENGHAEIILTHTPIADFDGDGVPDENDTEPYDPNAL